MAEGQIFPLRNPIGQFLMSSGGTIGAVLLAGHGLFQIVLWRVHNDIEHAVEGSAELVAALWAGSVWLRQKRHSQLTVNGFAEIKVESANLPNSSDDPAIQREVDKRLFRGTGSSGLPLPHKPPQKPLGQ